MSEQKHDGKLDDETNSWANATVEYVMDFSAIDRRVVYIQGGYGDMESSSISLDAKQALALLAWLEQERETLEQMAKEQQ